jgi:uncharacterized protein
MQSDSCNWSFCQKIQMYSFPNLIKQLCEVIYYLCTMINSINAIFSFLLSLPVLLYRYSISPFLRPSCRHVPSCSRYMLDALKIHGPFIGLLLGTGRILRCRPGGTHGYDPVPLFRFRRYRPLASIFGSGEKENRLKR